MNKDQWILSSERLPENHQEVLAWLSYDRRQIKTTYFSDRPWGKHVTHWMPLPEPPPPPDPFEEFARSNKSPSISHWIRMDDHDCHVHLARAIWDAAIESTKAKS